MERMDYTIDALHFEGGRRGKAYQVNPINTI
jgi:hypothetical protein